MNDLAPVYIGNLIQNFNDGEMIQYHVGMVVFHLLSQCQIGHCFEI